MILTKVLLGVVGSFFLEGHNFFPVFFTMVFLLSVLRNGRYSVDAVLKTKQKIGEKLGHGT